MRWANIEGTIIACDNGRMVPAVTGNSDYDAILASGEAIDAYVPPAPTANDVRAECDRRMRVFVGARNSAHLEIIISNANREAIRLLRKGSANWTPEDAARAAALEAADAEIERLRACSNAMEADPPADFKNDSRW